MMNEVDREPMLKWWESATTISPIHKDVKRRHINAKVFENPNSLPTIISCTKY
jgi:hypothetical protein